MLTVQQSAGVGVASVIEQTSLKIGEWLEVTTQTDPLALLKGND